MYSPHQKIKKPQMEYKEPKTRQEAKGRTDKKSKDILYQQKRVRQMEAIMEKKGKQPKKKN
jgi:hypothetical protein